MGLQPVHGRIRYQSCQLHKLVVKKTSDAKRILIAEDNVVLGDVIRFNLERSGYAVTLARNGIEALRQVASQPYDILVTDYEMPGVNGEELCFQVRNVLKLLDINIIMCSAKGLEIDHEALKGKYAISAIISKPFSIRDLLALLGKIEVKPNTPMPLITVSS